MSSSFGSILIVSEVFRLFLSEEDEREGFEIVCQEGTDKDAR